MVGTAGSGTTRWPFSEDPFVGRRLNSLPLLIHGTASSGRIWLKMLEALTGKGRAQIPGRTGGATMTE